MDPVTLRITAEVDEALKNVQQVRDAFLNFAGDYKKANSEMSKVSADIFGDTVVRKALQYSKAIEAIGGTSKLTAEEQKKVNTVVTQAIQKYQALGQQAPASLLAIQQATQQATTASSGFFTQMFTTITGGVAIGHLLSRAITSALSSIVDGVKEAITKIGEAFVYLANRGGEVDKIRVAFVKLSHDAGLVPEQLLAAGREGLRGLATDFDIMKSANQAMLFGLHMSTKEFGTLTSAAQVLGRAMGVDAGKSLNDLVVALGRTSPRILDNLGIIVKIKDANREYADSIHKDVLALNAEERQHAFYIKSMAMIEAKVKSLGEVQLNLSDRLLQVKNAWTNATDALAVAVTLSPVLNTAMDTIGKAIFDAFGTNQIETIQTLMDFINRVAIATVAGAKFITQSVMALIAMFGPFLAGQLKAAELVIDVVQKATHSLRSVYDLAAMVPMFGKPFADVMPTIKAMDDTIFNLGKGFKTASDETKNLSDNAVAGAQKTVKFLDEMMVKMRAQLGVRVSETLIVKGLNDLHKKNNEELDKELQLTKAQLRELERKKKLTAEALQFGYDAGKGIFDIWDSKEGEALFRQLTKDFRSVLNGKEFDWIQDWIEKLPALKKGLFDTVAGIKELGLRGANAFGGFGDNLPVVKKKTDDFADSLKELTRMMSQLKTISGDTWGGMIKDIAETLQLMELGAAAGKQFKDAIYNPKKFATGAKDSAGNMIYQGGYQSPFRNQEGDINTQSAIAGAVNVGTAAVAGYGALMQSTSSSSRGKNISKGAMTGASIGNSIVPGYGAIVGAVIGAVIGALRGAALRDEIKEIGKNWGLTLSDEMAKQIVQTSKDLFKGDRRTSELFLMDQIIAQGGGISDKNRKMLEGQLTEVIQAFTSGKMSAEQSKEVLEKNFGAFADYYAKTGKVISKEMRAIIAQTAEFQIQSESIKEFVQSNVEALSASLTNMLTPAVKNYAGIAAAIEEQKKSLVEAQKAVDELNKKEGGPGVEESEAANKALKDAQKEVDLLTAKQVEGGAKSKEAWDTAGLAALKGLNGAIKSGATYDEAFDRMGDSLTVLRGLQVDLGLVSDNAAITALLHEQELVEKYADRIAQVKSLNETTVALGNLNALDVEMLQRMEVQGKATYDSLIEAGFTQEQVLRRMVPFLESVVTASKEQGVAIDENTQGYIDQATEMDLFGKGAKNTNDILAAGFADFKSGIGALITTLGGELPAAWQEAARATKGATDAMAAGVTELDRKVGNTRDGWYTVGRAAKGAADESVDALGRVGKAAEDAQDKVDGVSVGHSPGGFKDIGPHADLAAKAVEKWRNRSVASAKAVEDAVNNVNQASIDGNFLGPEANRPIQLNEEYAFNFAPNVIDGTDLQDMVENEITPFVLSALEKNRQGALTRARQALGV